MAIEYRTSTVAALLGGGPEWDFIFDKLNLVDQNSYSLSCAKQKISLFLGNLKDDVFVIIETDYVDKVYRDSYYNYFASKLNNLSRNCIRLSFIDPGIKHIDLSQEKLSEIPNFYKGFVVLRPLPLAIIGRNAINPSVLKCSVDFAICKSPIISTCLGIKTTVPAFPHSSQDGEMMTCAETTIWLIFEYFGNKYPEYSPILPSEIHKILKPHAYQRQIPSAGLTFDQIARVFNNHGFGCKIYFGSGNPKFNEILSTYMESGIPLAICLQSSTIGHAVVAVGHKNIDRNSIDPVQLQDINGKRYYIWNKMSSELIFNDDNLLPYASAPISNPAANYTSPMWSGVAITMFIVPLNNKIYMDAEMALGFSQWLASDAIKVDENSVLRTFLASGRSYKQYLMKNPDIPEHIKQKYLSLPMAKFVWVTEFSDLSTCKQNKVNGVLIVDATNPKPLSMPLIFAQYKGLEISFDSATSNFIRTPGFTSEFREYSQNLL